MSSSAAFHPSKRASATPSARVLKRLGRYLDQEISHRRDIVRLTQEGLPYTALEVLLKRTKLTQSEAAWIIQPRTLAHRRTAQQPLTVDETGKLFRLANVLALAEEVFGDENQARPWLHKPLRALEGRSPMEALRTEEGAKLVEEFLWKIASGFFA